MPDTNFACTFKAFEKMLGQETAAGVGEGLKFFKMSPL